MIVKLVGFLAYALGVGLLFFTFLMEEPFKTLLGVNDSNNGAMTESNAPLESNPPTESNTHTEEIRQQ